MNDKLEIINKSKEKLALLKEKTQTELSESLEIKHKKMLEEQDARVKKVGSEIRDIADEMKIVNRNIEIISTVKEKVDYKIEVGNNISKFNIALGIYSGFENMVVDFLVQNTDSFKKLITNTNAILDVRKNITLKEIDRLDDIFRSIRMLLESHVLKNKYDDKYKMRYLKEKVILALPYYIKLDEFLDNSLDLLYARKTVLIETEEKKTNELIEAREITEDDISSTAKEEIITSRLNRIEELEKMILEYENNEDNELFVKLCNELSSLGIITLRNAKILTYEKEEKEEVEDENNIKEETIPEIIVNENILDGDYFRRSDTKHIICFLGDNGTEVMDDINRHFDGKSRKNVLAEMNNLFNTLYNTEIDSDNYIETGGNPKYFTDPLASALISSPLNYSYRRYGVHKDQYRIHAITKHSDLLNELGYGKGNVIFFGAVGVNDQTKKSDAYHRIGSRAIESLSTTGGSCKLRNNFNYIEHIIKKQIPLTLLSDEDKSKIRKGQFNGKIKGTRISKSYEDMKYFYYDLLDVDSRANVKKYLDDYFIKQTNTMFEIMDNYVKKKELSHD